MFDTMFNNWDNTRTYKTLTTLEKALSDASINIKELGGLLVQVPTGKNTGRYTVVFPFRQGDNNHLVFSGYKVMG